MVLDELAWGAAIIHELDDDGAVILHAAFRELSERIGDDTRRVRVLPIICREEDFVLCMYDKISVVTHDIRNDRDDGKWNHPG